MGKRIQEISAEALEVLMGYQWPGNVRELQNVMERLVILSKGDRIEVPDLPRYLVDSAGAKPLSSGIPSERFDRISLENSVHDFERNLILKALQKCGNNKTRAAHLLGLTRSTFRYKLSKISPDYFPAADRKAKSV